MSCPPGRCPSAGLSPGRRWPCNAPGPLAPLVGSGGCATRAVRCSNLWLPLRGPRGCLKVVPDGAHRLPSLPVSQGGRPNSLHTDCGRSPCLGTNRLSALHPRLSPCSFLCLSASPTGNLPVPRPLASARKALALSPPGNTAWSSKTWLKQYLPRLGGLSLSSYHPVLQSRPDNLWDPAQCLEPTILPGAHENILIYFEIRRQK